MNAITKLSYTHDAMIDLIIANPAASMRQIAHQFGYTETWCSRVVSSDAFQARLKERKAELVNPVLIDTLENKFEALIHQSMEVVQEQLQNSRDPELAMKAMEVAAKAKGFGARNVGNAVQVNNYVAMMPQPEQSVDSWSAKHAPVDVVENKS